MSQAQSSLPVAFVVAIGGTVAVLVHAIGAEGLGLVGLRAHGRVCVCVCVCVCVNVSLRLRKDVPGVMEGSAVEEEEEECKRQ